MLKYFITQGVGSPSYATGQRHSYTKFFKTQWFQMLYQYIMYDSLFAVINVHYYNNSTFLD